MKLLQKNNFKTRSRVIEVKRKILTTDQIDSCLNNKVLSESSDFKYRECFDKLSETVLSAKYFNFSNVSHPNAFRQSLFKNECEILNMFNCKYLAFMHQATENKKRGIMVMDQFTGKRLQDLKNEGLCSPFYRSVRRIVIGIAYSDFLTSARIKKGGA